MKNTSKNELISVTVLPLSAELLKNRNELATEEVVIYDECGDTLWDRVLAQEDKIANAAQMHKPGDLKD